MVFNVQKGPSKMMSPILEEKSKKEDKKRPMLKNMVEEAMKKLKPFYHFENLREKD